MSTVFDHERVAATVLHLPGFDLTRMARRLTHNKRQRQYKLDGKLRDLCKKRMTGGVNERF